MDAVSAGTISYASSSKKEGTQSLVLNGQDAFLQLPAQVGNQTCFTIGAWVYWKNTGAQWTRIFDFGNGTDEYMFLTPSNGSQMRFVIKHDGVEQILSASRLQTGWHHVVVSLDESMQAVLYVDGKQKGSKQMTCTPAMLNLSRCYVGKSQFSADPLFRGNIDDLRIYSYALSAEDIAHWYQGEPITGIQGIEANSPSSSSSSSAAIIQQQIYSLNGALQDSKHQGVNIVKQIDAKGKVITRKVMY